MRVSVLGVVCSCVSLQDSNLLLNSVLINMRTQSRSSEGLVLVLTY